jgi:hypothetical protein
LKSKNVIKVALFVSLFVCHSWGQNNPAPQNSAPVPRNFAGTVVDDAGAPFSRVHIWIHQDNGLSSLATYTDSSGRFSTWIPDGYYDILFSSSGFSPFCKKIWIRDGKTVSLNIQLKRDREYAIPD